MAIFLCNVGLAATLLQAALPVARVDTLDALRARVAKDSGDADAWFLLGAGYLQLSSTYHAHHGGPIPDDTLWARAILDTADEAFTRVATLRAGTVVGDSARVLRGIAWSERAILAWEQGGSDAVARTWAKLPADAKPPAVLQELGENLLRACPRQGVLLTAGAPSRYSTWYMRFGLGMRPDVLVLPLEVWRGDSAMRQEIRRERRVRGRRGTDQGLDGVIDKRPVCASMGFEQAPDIRPKQRWSTRPLVWTAGPGAGANPVPPQDFVFAALKLALDANDVWARPAIAVYRRAAALTPALCRSMTGFGVPAEVVACRR